MVWIEAKEMSAAFAEKLMRTTDLSFRCNKYEADASCWLVYLNIWKQEGTAGQAVAKVKKNKKLNLLTNPLSKTDLFGEAVNVWKHYAV